MHTRACFLMLLLGVALLGPAACDRKPNPDAATPAPVVQNAGPAPTAEEAQQFAAAVAQAVRARDAAQFNRLLRLSELAQRLVSDLDISDQERQSFLRGAEAAIQQNSVGQQILHELDSGGSYKLLRVHEKEGRQRVLFRLLTAAGAVNYHDYLLTRFPDGSVATEDIYVFVTAEPFSQSLRRLLIPALTQGGRGRIKGTDDEYVASFRTLVAMSRSLQQGRPAEAAAQYQQLPPTIQQNKAILVIYLRATALMGEAGEKDYLAGMERFRALDPDDPAVEFISIDYYTLKKDFDAALKAVDRVDTAVGGDPYLHALRANLLVEAGRFDQARTAAEKAVELEPDSDKGYWTRILVSLREKKFDDTLAWLKKLVQALPMEIKDLTKLPEYAGFVKSPQHRAWLKWYQARKKN